MAYLLLNYFPSQNTDRYESIFRSSSHMTVIIFSSTGNESNKKLLQGVVPLLTDIQVEICNSIPKLSHRLRQPLEGNVIGLFMIATHEELSTILSIHLLLRNMKIVLILPDKSEGTISKGHSLRPRFLGYFDDDFQDVAAVINKMAHSRIVERTVRGTLGVEKRF